MIGVMPPAPRRAEVFAREWPETSEDMREA